MARTHLQAKKSYRKGDTVVTTIISLIWFGVLGMPIEPSGLERRCHISRYEYLPI